MHEASRSSTHKPVCIAIVCRVHEAIHNEKEGPFAIALIVDVKTFSLREANLGIYHGKVSTNPYDVEHDEDVNCTRQCTHSSLDRKNVGNKVQCPSSKYLDETAAEGIERTSANCEYDTIELVILID
jgi:hypothetical protein